MGPRSASVPVIIVVSSPVMTSRGARSLPDDVVPAATAQALRALPNEAGLRPPRSTHSVETITARPSAATVIRTLWRVLLTSWAGCPR